MIGSALSLRARLMALSVAGLAVGLALGGVALLVALGYTLHGTADEEAFKTADAVAMLAAEDALPDPLPVAGAGVRVQVVDAEGRVRAASIGADRLVPMLYRRELAGMAAREGRYVPGERLGISGPVRVVAVAAGPPGDPQTVLVAKSLTDMEHSLKVVRGILLVGFPLLLAGLAAVAWRMIGATLRPVERARIRQRAFVADAAHELRSPLANMRTQLEVAQRLADRTDWPEVAGELLLDIHRMSGLVDDLLLLARADDAPPGPGRAGQRVELGDLVSAVAARYPSPPVRLAQPAGPAWTTGDPGEIRRILANLLDNAVRHAGGTVLVTVTVGGAGGAHLVMVADDGPGIPAGDRERVFDRFTRLDDARARDAGGAGLGLAIVRKLVRRQGGEVHLADAEPGLLVRVHLPVADLPVADLPGGPPGGDGQRSGDAADRVVQTGSARPTVSAE